MKKLISGLVLTAMALPLPAIAGHRHPYAGTYEEVCYKDVYTETYVPGNSRRRGYVRYDTQRVRVPCRRPPLDTTNIGPWEPGPDYRPTGRVDDNSCVEGAIIGGILGGAATAAGSRGPDMAWAIPLGVVGGSLVGCQVDGG